MGGGYSGGGGGGEGEFGIAHGRTRYVGYSYAMALALFLGPPWVDGGLHGQWKPMSSYEGRPL